MRWSVDLEPFEIGVYPVTQEQLAEMIGETASHPRRPATDVSWLRAIRFCNAASEWEGLDPVYTFDGEDVTWHVDADGYRLPTEAEWEFACRAGSTGPHYGPLAEVAWTSADGVTTPQEIGAKLPNLNGLFDTLGNVWEWCWDLLDPARYDAYRVFRGGGFADDAWSVRASTRRGGAPRMHHEDVGFRVARGGFDATDAAQGWSAEADRERAAIDGPLPSGWTPRADELQSAADSRGGLYMNSMRMPLSSSTKERVVAVVEPRVQLGLADGRPTRAERDRMQAIDLGARIDGEGEVLPADPAVPVRSAARFAGGAEDQLLLALVPGHSVVGIEPRAAERLHHRIELCDRARQVVDGDSDVVEKRHPGHPMGELFGPCRSQPP